MNLQEKAKTEIAWFTCLVALVGMLGGMWQSYQRETSFVVLANDNPDVFEPIPPANKELHEEQIEYVEIAEEDPVFFDVAEGWEEVAEYIKEVFQDESYTALRVAHCESRFGRDRVNTNKDGSLDIGPFQINSKWHSDKGDLYDWKENVRIAKQIHDEWGGWEAWVCYKQYSHGW